jgi:hypothetical protein
MSTVNVYFSQGTRNEQTLIEDIIIESLKIYGQELFYIPRTLVSKDNILGEDRLSKFRTSFPIEMYFENVDSFDGQGAFIQKFGLMMEQSATLVVARRRWDQLVGRYEVNQLPNRPCEGDLIYFPLTKGLFEIKFVQHQDPFYQLGKLYVYKLQVELFQYSSEKLDTGIAEVDVFESLKTFSTDLVRSSAGQIKEIVVNNPGSGYTTADVSITSNVGYGATAEANIVDGLVDSITVTNGGQMYNNVDSVYVTITGDGVDATAEAIVDHNIDKVESYGDNNSFVNEAASLIFHESNPFGDVIPATPTVETFSADSTSITADNTTITADRT